MFALPWAYLVAALTSTVAWHAVRPGIERADFPFANSGALSYVHVVALRVDPCKIRLRGESRFFDGGLRNDWSVHPFPNPQVLALNAGQFSGSTPFGWSVRNGKELQAPGFGPLSMAITVDSTGRVSLLTPTEFAAHRNHVSEAWQSYPTLLVDSAIPSQLLPNSHAINLEHHDSRLAIGTASNGAVIIALTRVGKSAGSASALPYGPTIPELAQLMQRLGATRAVGLDGGLSSQLALRDAAGRVSQWTNWRKVPEGIVGVAQGCGG